MKRLAECVPGREIRAGARRLRTRARGFTIKSSSSEQVSRFLQDTRRNELRLTVIRTSDRNKIAHLANLYSLSLRYEAPCQVGWQPNHIQDPISIFLEMGNILLVLIRLILLVTGQPVFSRDSFVQDWENPPSSGGISCPWW